MNPLISVIIPLYNKFEFIQKAICSVLNQTYPHFELIVIDDGSTDGSQNLVDKIIDTRIRFIRQTNAGVSAAKNRGIEEAKYDLLAFLDADDWWDEDFLFSMVKLIEKYPQSCLYASRYAIVAHGKATPSPQFFDESSRYLSFDLIAFGAKSKTVDLPLHSSSIIIRKSIFDQVDKFDERISIYEDYDLFLRIGVFSTVGYLNGKPLAYYSQDCPAENRLTGKLPSLHSHFLYYLEKFEDYIRIKPQLKIYIDNFKLTKSMDYIENRSETKIIKEIIKTVDRKNYQLKHKVYYSNFILLYFLLKINSLLLKIKKSCVDLVKKYR